MAKVVLSACDTPLQVVIIVLLVKIYQALTRPHPAPVENPAPAPEVIQLRADVARLTSDVEHVSREVLSFWLGFETCFDIRPKAINKRAKNKRSVFSLQYFLEWPCIWALGWRASRAFQVAKASVRPTSPIPGDGGLLGNPRLPLPSPIFGQFRGIWRCYGWSWLGQILDLADDQIKNLPNHTKPKYTKKYYRTKLYQTKSIPNLLKCCCCFKFLPYSFSISSLLMKPGDVKISDD